MGLDLEFPVTKKRGQYIWGLHAHKINACPANPDNHFALDKRMESLDPRMCMWYQCLGKTGDSLIFLQGGSRNSDLEWVQ